MRIVIPTTGSQGDLHPYVALGVGLQAAGHKVRVVTHADFGPLVRGRGLDFCPIQDESRVLHESPAGRKMITSGGNPLAFLRNFAELRKPMLPRLVAGCLEAARDADLILAATTAFLPGHAVAEKLRIPMFPAHFVPAGPSRLLPSCVMPEAPAWLPGRGLYNRLSHLFVGEFLWQLVGTTINQARQDMLGLSALPFLGPPLRLFEDLPVLYGYSPLVVPPPADLGPNHAVTGYWHLDRVPGWRPSPALLDFLRAGPPPVSVGFGSMQAGQADRLTDLVSQALARCGQRGILLTGWGGLSRTGRSDRLFATEAVPHDWLFPRMAAVVHHGGAGTTAAGLRAGVPNVIIPFMADQPFWGRRVAQLGVGPKPILRERVTVERLARAIDAALNDLALRARAAELGAKLRAEDGVANAVDAFHRLVTAPALRVPGERRYWAIPDELPRRAPVRRRRLSVAAHEEAVS